MIRLRGGEVSLMGQARGAAPAIRRAGSVALITAFVGMAGCASSSSSPGGGSTPGTGSSPGPASASPGLSVPGTHKATARYQITAPVSTVVIVSHVGNVTVTGGSGPGVSVTQQVYYSKTPPTTTRTVSGTTLTVTYDCPGQLVCGVVYTLAVPRSAAVRVTAGAGSVRLTHRRADRGASLGQRRRDHGTRARHHVLQDRRRRAGGQDDRQRPAERLIRPRHHRDHGRRRHRRRPVTLAPGRPTGPSRFIG